MVSQKLVIVLITVAILLSAVSIAVTLSSINDSLIPEPAPPPQYNLIPGKVIPDAEKGQVAIDIKPPRATTG
jgi:hypothetical protein